MPPPLVTGTPQPRCAFCWTVRERVALQTDFKRRRPFISRATACADFPALFPTPPGARLYRHNGSRRFFIKSKVVKEMLTMGTTLM